jgi:hypothetical protein
MAGPAVLIPVICQNGCRDAGWMVRYRPASAGAASAMMAKATPPTGFARHDREGL